MGALIGIAAGLGAALWAKLRFDKDRAHVFDRAHAAGNHEEHHHGH